jgi:ribosomal protein S18 acetylase RimI-like enzyme
VSTPPTNRIKFQHIQTIATVLAKAFFNNSFYTYIMPDTSKRARQLTWWMACLTRYGYQYGEVYTTPDSIKGAAIWLGPETPQPNAVQMARIGLYQAPFRLGLVSFLRMLWTTTVWDSLHKQEPARHWYLMILGVETSYQGQGFGSSLLQPVLERADQAGLTCYLETTSEGNVRFYQKHGFEVVIEDRTKNEEMHYWTMRRVPCS